MNLSVVIPVKNDPIGLEACLQSIEISAVEAVGYEVLVVDNGSTDNTIAVAERYGATVLQDPHATVAALRNLGAEKSTGDVLAFLDADCTIDPGWFESLVP